MKVTLWVRLALWFRRTKRKVQRMNTPAILTSKTTQNQLAASGGVAGMVIAALTFLRATFPAVVPWPAELDVHVVAILTTILAVVPILSRSLSMWRDPDKRDRAALTDAIGAAILELPPDVVAGGVTAAREIAENLSKPKKNRPPVGTPQQRKLAYIAFAAKVKKEAEAARAARHK